MIKRRKTRRERDETNQLPLESVAVKFYGAFRKPFSPFAMIIIHICPAATGRMGSDLGRCRYCPVPVITVVCSHAAGGTAAVIHRYGPRGGYYVVVKG